MHVLLCDGTHKVMEHHGPFFNKECAMGAPDRSSLVPKTLQERERKTEQKRLPMPPLPADKFAVKTKGCKTVMAKS